MISSTHSSLLVLLHTLQSAASSSVIPLDPSLAQLDWLVGRWVSSPTAGRVQWPSIPTMKFGETLDFWPAEQSSQADGVVFLNYSSVAEGWQGDRFHNEFGYMTIVPSNHQVMLFAIGSNGFATVEKGYSQTGYMLLETVEVDKLSLAREVPTEAIKREFRLSGDYLYLTLSMRTYSHPPHSSDCQLSRSCPFKVHATNVYRRVLTLQDLQLKEQLSAKPNEENNFQ